MTLRRTKIVATLGPASNSPEKIAELIKAGMNVARLNFSHGSANEHRERARLVREIAEQKIGDMNAVDVDGAMAMVRGSARAMGLEVVEG